MRLKVKDFLAVLSIAGFIIVSILCLLAAKFGQEWATKMMDTILPMVIQCWINNFTIVMMSKYGHTDSSQQKSDLIGKMLQNKIENQDAINLIDEVKK